MSIKTELYEQWSAAVDAAAEAVKKAYWVNDATAAKNKRFAYEDGLRILHEADGTDHIKQTLRERMKDNPLAVRRNHYAQMLNDVELALERGDEPKAVR